MHDPAPRHLVIDTSVYITYTRHQKLYRLIDAVLTYELIVYLSPALVDELRRNIPPTSSVELPSFIYDEYLAAIQAVCVHYEPFSRYRDSPDPKDNFLWDLALQTGSEVIVTMESALLNFTASPIPVHDLKWFKETYPVPL